MKIENPFRSKLYHHALPVREEVWESIEKRLPPNEEKRFPFFWFLLFASTLISGALMFGIISKKTTLPANPVKSPSYTLSTPETLNQASTPELNATDVNQNNTSKLSESASASSSSLDNSTSSGNSASVSKSNSIGNTSSAGNSNLSGTEGTASSASHSNSKKSTSQKQSQTSGKTKSTSASNSTSIDIFQASNESKNAEAWSSGNNIRSTSLLPLTDVGELNKPGVDVIGIRKSKPDPNCYKFSGISGNYYFSVDAFAGPGFSPRSFTAVDSESSSYTQAREATESKQYAWSAGARINLNLRSGLAFRLGLLYDQAGDVFDYTDTLATHSTTQIDSFFAADGTFLYSDSSRVLIFGTLIKKIHNTYRHLDVPLLVSYEMPLGRSSSIMFNVGPVFNLSTSYEGQILDPMLHPRSITPGSQNELYAYKTNVGISLYFGAGVAFPITDKISGLVEPRYLYRIKPVTIESYPLEEHRNFAGLNLGLRYYLD